MGHMGSERNTAAHSGPQGTLIASPISLHFSLIKNIRKKQTKYEHPTNMVDNEAQSYYDNIQQTK